MILSCALQEARKTARTTVITVPSDRYVGVPGYESWWDVQVAEEVSEMPGVREAQGLGGDQGEKSGIFSNRGIEGAGKSQRGRVAKPSVARAVSGNPG